MRFSELRVGDFFRSHGETFLKLPKVIAVEAADANAVNAATGQLACFGLTVPVDYAGSSDAAGRVYQVASDTEQKPGNTLSTRRFEGADKTRVHSNQVC
jgi:hypothetical protein